MNADYQSYNRMEERRQPSRIIKDTYAAECQSCGMCCVRYFYFPFCAAVEDSNPPQEPPRKLVQIGPRKGALNRYLRRVPIGISKWDGFGKCVALDLTLAPSHKASCTIYEQRPKCCTDFDPGSPACQSIREWARMDPPAGLVELGRS